jgi:hypothetical protein
MINMATFAHAQHMWRGFSSTAHYDLLAGISEEENARKPSHLDGTGSRSLPSVTNLEYYTYPVNLMLERYLSPRDIDKMTSGMIKVYRSLHRRISEDSVYRTGHQD